MSEPRVIQVVVDAGSWPGGTGELAEILSRHTGRAAMQLRVALQRGDVVVWQGESTEEAERELALLRSLGVTPALQNGPLAQVAVPVPLQGVQVPRKGVPPAVVSPEPGADEISGTRLGGWGAWARPDEPKTAMGSPGMVDDDGERVAREAEAAPVEASPSPLQQPGWAQLGFAKEAAARPVRTVQAGAGGVTRGVGDGGWSAAPRATRVEAADAPPAAEAERIAAAVPAGSSPEAMPEPATADASGAAQPSPEQFDGWAKVLPRPVEGDRITTAADAADRNRGERAPTPAGPRPPQLAARRAAEQDPLATRPAGMAPPLLFGGGPSADPREARPTRRPREGHSPLRAAAWSVAAPGGGQLYNGESLRAAVLALLGVLVIPWIYSVFDAWDRAEEIRDGGRGLERASTAGQRLIHAVGFWAVAGVIAAGVVSFEPSVIGRLDNVATSVSPSRPAMRSVAEVPAGNLAEHDARRALLGQLVRDADAACAAGNYLECKQLAEQALEIDETYRPAHSTYIKAVAALGAAAPEGSR